MRFERGARLGPYEILAPLGAGGMGEVYRARDLRLERDVAVKVLPDSVSRDAETLARFDREAKAVAKLSHPNIVALFDVGTHDGAAFVVMELLEGETLRARLVLGALGLRKGFEIGASIARGLAAAHEKGVVHRDVKPENVFLTKAGGVKVLDFGLARQTRPERADVSDLPTATEGGTSPGAVLGTVGYMAPEQVRGEAATPRTDIFALGVVLHEMLTGANPFRRPTAAETLVAILSHEPTDPALAVSGLSPSASRVVLRCLEKRAEDRFQSARDLAFALESSHPASSPAIRVAPSRPRPNARAVVAGLVSLGLLAGAFLLGRSFALLNAVGVPTMSQLTWRNGYVIAGRFAPDGQTVVYGARWQAEPAKLYTTALGSLESRPLDVEAATVLSISRSGEMALLLDTRFDGHGIAVCGTLAQVELTGGAPRPLMEAVRGADWSPDGRQLAIVRCGPTYSLEFPAGRPIAVAPMFLFPRVSRDGARVAVFEYPAEASSGVLVVVDRDGKRTALTDLLFRPRGLVWSPAGDEVWFTYQDNRGTTPIEAVNLSGRRRLLGRLAEFAVLEDVTASGRVLVTTQHDRVHALARTAFTGGEERDLSWFDGSNAYDLTDDGRILAITEQAAAGGHDFTTYLRPTNGGPAVRIGPGEGWSIAPDQAWLLTILENGGRLRAMPVGPGVPRDLGSSEFTAYNDVVWRGAGEVAFIAQDASGTRQLYQQGLGGERPRHLALPFSPETIWVSPDASRLLVRKPREKWIELEFPSHRLRDAPPPLGKNDEVVSWAKDGLYVVQRLDADPFDQRADIGLDVERIEPKTGRRTRWRRLGPSDVTGVVNTSVGRIVDSETYCYSYVRILSNLRVMEGLR